MANLREHRPFFLVRVLVSILILAVYVVSSFWPRYEERLCESDLLAGRSEETEYHYLIGVSASTQDEAYELIQVADRSVSSAFEAVLEAENAGANVSVLIVRLNEAVSLLVEAKVSFRNGEFGEKSIRA